MWEGKIFICQNIANGTEREISMVLNIWMAIREAQRASGALHQQL